MILNQSGILNSRPKVAAGPNVVGAIAAANNMASMPAHVAGDLLFMYAYQYYNNNAPSCPAGWTSLSPSGLTGAGTGNGVRIGYKIATSSSETSGTWSGAHRLMCAVVHKAGVAIGNAATIKVAGAASPIAANAISPLADASGSSIILFAYTSQGGTNNSLLMPVGFTYLTGGGGSSIGMGYSSGGVTSFGGASIDFGFNTTHAAAACEIRNAV